jgi:hypothetical protein
MTSDAATWWQAIGSVVTAVATTGLVVITYLYVRATRRILEQSAHQAAAAEKQAAAMRDNLEFMRRAAVPEWALLVNAQTGYLVLEFLNLSEVDALRISYTLAVTSGPQAKKLILKPPQRPPQLFVAARKTFTATLEPGSVPFDGELALQSTGRWGLQQTTTWSVKVHQRGDTLFELVQLLPPRVDYS